MKKSKPVHKREMPIDEVKEFIKSLLDECGDVFHSHVRAWQIVRQTRKNIEHFAASFKFVII